MKYSRHPYLEEVKEEIRQLDITIEEIVSESDNAILRRAVERVKEAIQKSEISKQGKSYDASKQDNKHKVELLSYVVARVLVSIIGDRKLIERYSESEARRSIREFKRNTQKKNVFRPGAKVSIEIDYLFDEFDFAHKPETDNEPYPDSYNLHLSDYLRLAPTRKGEWGLKARQVDSGTVPIREGELHELLVTAIQDRVASELPLDVPEPIVESLSGELNEIRSLIGEWGTNSTDIDTFEPEAFPDCIKRIHNSIRNGDQLDVYEYAGFFAFLNHIGLKQDDVYRHYPEVSSDAVVDSIVTRIFDGGITLPSCLALDGLGVCEADELDSGTHFVQMYRQNLAEHTEAPKVGEAAT